MPTLLIVHHTPSPATRELLEAVLQGADDPEISGVDVRAVPALSATASDFPAADGYLFGMSANFGYLSGGLEHYLPPYPPITSTAKSAA